MGSTAKKRTPAFDPTVYPVSDDMGESSIETFVRVVMIPLLERYFASRGERAFVGGNQFIYYEQYNPKKCCVAPDLYVLPGVEPRTEISSVKLWEDWPTPSFVLEVVSDDADKDYLHGPPRYDRVGVAELVVFDPHWEERRDGVMWQVYRRVKERGLVCVETTNVDRVRSKVLGCWLRLVHQRGQRQLRLGTGPTGDDLFPTDHEAERAAREAERAARDAERAARDEIARLRAQLDARAKKSRKRR